MSSLEKFAERVDDLWVRHLSVDLEWEAHQPNRTSREVKSGHYVFVKPTPLPDAKLIHISPLLAEELELDPEECKQDSRFVRFFSGDTEALPQFPHSWATPYALAIYGTDYIQNCPFGTGNGYGDGRAISIGEITLPSNKHWEFQLKGAGPTPFCRGADGRAVLRSSVREYLVSEAMHCLRVSTTRAISLIVSESEVVKRPWYKPEKPSLPMAQLQKLASLPDQYRQHIMAQIQAQLQQPNIMVDNQAAITCRVAPSFLRVGHIQLFERRARKDPERKKELQDIVAHALLREFPDINEMEIDFQEKVLLMLKRASEQIAKLTADWIRVGFCQGNFNSDNCLVAGRTMDYGPFGFMERFKPLWNMWSGGGEHFGFLNQPKAGEKNFGSLCHAVEPLLNKKGVLEVEDILEDHQTNARNALHEVWCAKLGFSKQSWSTKVDSLVKDLLQLLEKSQGDYTIFWRELSCLCEKFFSSGCMTGDDMAYLEHCFYGPLPCNLRDQFVTWLNRWLTMLQENSSATGTSVEEIVGQMRQVSPKYIPREWMLVQAYTDAMKGDYENLKELYELFRNPYDEQAEMEAKYYKKAPLEVYEGVGQGGTAFMT